MSSTPDRDSKKHIYQQAIDWVFLLDEREPSAGERARLDAWLTADRAHADAFAKARQLYGDAAHALAADPDRTIRQIRKSRGKGIAAAAIIGLALASSPYWSDLRLYLQADIVTAADEMPLVTLADGSRAHLNASSALSEEITGERRRVALLQGEAYFEVARDPQRPFVVEAGAGRIEVLGTAFNVNRVSGRTEVTVTESAVLVTGAAGSGSVTLKPGMRVSYDEDGTLGAVERVAAGMETPWRSGRLMFHERRLDAMLEEIARHVPGKVILASRSSGERVISGSFDLSDPQDALQSFAAAFGLKLVRAGPLFTLVY